MAHPRSAGDDVPDGTGRPDRGVSSIEYSLALTGVAALVLMVVLSLGDQLSAMFDCLSEQLGGNLGACSSGTVIDPGGTDPGGTDPGGGSSGPGPAVTGQPDAAPVTETGTSPAGSASPTTTTTSPSPTTTTRTSTTGTAR